MTNRERTLKRILGGRKNVIVSTWKWGVPQTITTLQRVPLPPQRVLPGRRLESAVLSFSDYLNAHADEHHPASHKETQ